REERDADEEGQGELLDGPLGVRAERGARHLLLIGGGGIPGLGDHFGSGGHGVPRGLGGRLRFRNLRRRKYGSARSTRNRAARVTARKPFSPVWVYSGEYQYGKGVPERLRVCAQSDAMGTA